MFNRYRRGLFITAFLAAPVTLYLVYVISPYMQAFYIAMTDWRGVTATPNFI
ncbi:MAG: transporter permease subunit, partial [Nonomuraea muscovyensis]|nr:transporter permease subunit [Nonomuraea muscovyensis]